MLISKNDYLTSFRNANSIITNGESMHSAGAIFLGNSVQRDEHFTTLRLRGELDGIPDEIL